ncbi:MAG TPA: TIGR02217 family protein [Rhizobiales bacterium]|nr:TIGR02217 family protein [Hyphomicrobiales bacterium]
MAFHEIRFPTAISLGATGGPERRTEIVALASGYEQRNARWADSRRRYNAGYGVKSLDQIHEIIAFFEERMGRLHGFRWKDGGDHKSCPPGQSPASDDQGLGTGDASTASFQLIKTYGAGLTSWTRNITKPVSGTVKLAVSGVAQNPGTDFTIDETTGVITFLPGHIPASGATVSAGFEFDVPVRFDTDFLEINLEAFGAGAIPDIPVVEIRL